MLSDVWMESDLLGFQLSQAVFLHVQQLLNGASKKNLKAAASDLKQVSPLASTGSCKGARDHRTCVQFFFL